MSKFKDIIAGDTPVLVDFHAEWCSPGEYAGGHVKGSKNIPLGNIEAKLKTIKKWNKPVITCCASGMRSGSAASILKRNGVEAYNAGSWQKANRLTS